METMTSVSEKDAKYGYCEDNMTRKAWSSLTKLPKLCLLGDRLRLAKRNADLQSLGETLYAGKLNCQPREFIIWRQTYVPWLNGAIASKLIELVSGKIIDETNLAELRKRIINDIAFYDAMIDYNL